MAATNFTTVDAAANALVNAAIRQGVTPSTYLSAQQLPVSVLANVLAGQMGGASLLTGPAAGITSGTGTIARTSVTTEGGLQITRILVDLTGLASSTTDLDIIGVGANPAFIAQISSAESGTILGGTVTCLELPAGGVTDIDVYKATVGTGVFDGAATSLTGQGAVLTSGGAWALGTVRSIGADSIASGDFLYLTSGAAGTAATYTAGRLLFTLFGVNV